MSELPGIRTYKLRRSRITAGQSAAIADFGGRWLLPSSAAPSSEWLAKYQRFVLEIGFGMGEATVGLAKAQPETAVLAADLHTPGIGHLIGALEREQLDNVRVTESDGLQLLTDHFNSGELDGVRIFFPDPWPKARHHKRRLLNPANLDLIANGVKVGGWLHFATDWPNYAEQAAEVIEASQGWRLLPAGEGVPGAIPSERPRTRFEQRGIDAGRPIADLVAIRLS